MRFVEGWFGDTLHELHDQRWALIRLDADMYQSTTEALTHLYPNLSPGGFLIVDDYCVPACRQAVHDYREANGVSEPIQRIDWAGVYWQRESDALVDSDVPSRDDDAYSARRGSAEVTPPSGGSGTGCSVP